MFFELGFVENRIAIYIPLLFLLDIFITVKWMKRYRDNFPDDNNWRNFEVNPLARYCWKKFGLILGSIIAVILISPIILLITTIALKYSFVLGYVLGIYHIIFILHFKAYIHLDRMILKKQSEKAL